MRILVPALLWCCLITPAPAYPMPRGPFVSPRVRAARMTTAAHGAVRLVVHHEWGAAALRAMGFQATPLSASVASVTLQAGEMDGLLLVPGLLGVDVPHRYRPLLDVSGPLIGAPAARTTYGVTGAGVLVTIVDTGIDFRHQDFLLQSGHTRLRWLMDAAAPRGGLHPELPDYRGMAIYSADDINAVLDAEAAGKTPPLVITEQDQFGHGTHVAGIAAGNGGATGHGKPAGRYVGMAPQADLCVVQATRKGNNFADEDIVAGVQFCVDRAQDAHQPVVVNLSLGGNSGPHDGSLPIEQALNEIIGELPGRALVAAAGNSGEDDLHAGGYQMQGDRTIPIHINTSGTAPPSGSQGVVEIYDVGGDVSITVKSPKGQTVGPIAPGATGTKSLTDPAEGQVVIDNSDNTAGAQRGAAVVISGQTGQEPVTGEWSLVLSGQASRYDVWVGDETEDLSLRLTGHLDLDTTLGSPATAAQALSVGSFVSRITWPRVDSMTVDRAVTAALQVPPLQGSFFTGSGPTADGRFAPDIAAPGEWIASSLASTALPTMSGSVFHVAADQNYLWADDGAHALLRGTSQAAPHVTGVVALLLQRNPMLHTETLRELLRTTGTGTAGYSTRLGFGKLDAGLLLGKLQGQAAGALSVAGSLVGVSRDLVPPGGKTTVTVVPKDGAGVPLGAGLAVSIDIDSAAGGSFEGPVQDLGSGRYERVLTVAPPLGGKLTVTASVKGQALAHRPVVFVEAERSAIGQGTGGCAAAPGGGAGGWALGLWGVLGLLGRRRRGSRDQRWKS